MSILRHELKLSRVSLAGWTVSIGFLLAVCIFLFPEMKGEMNQVGDMFADMGGFTQAFGMDRVNFGTLLGFYAVECGNILGLGGGFFAALCGVSVLAREEREHTAEFLLTHPVSRARVVSEKLLAVFLQVGILNAAVFGLSVCSIALIGEDIPWRETVLLHLAYFLLQVEIAGICFGFSAFLRRSSLGLGLGFAAVLYFLNIIANLSDKAAFLKWITPFGFADGAQIAADGTLKSGWVLLGMGFCLAGIAAAYAKYIRKDIS